MNPSETAELLGTIQAFDRRTVGEADVAAWHAILANETLADCRDVVIEHFGKSKDWLMPSDIKVSISKMRSRRIGEVAAVTPPWQLAEDPGAEIQWVSNYRHAIADGLPQGTAIAKANYMAGINDEPEPLALSAPATALKAQMEAEAQELVRRQSLKDADARRAAEEKRERYKRIRASELALKNTTPTQETA